VNVVRTVVAPEAVAELVCRQYPVRGPAACRLHSVAIHDHYLIEADGRRLVLRLYNAEHSATPDHPAGLFELELLAFLAERGQPVAAPVARADGSRFGRLDAAEGSRRYALFSFAEGRPVYPPPPAQARVLGAAVARLHEAMSGFQGAPPAADLELDGLLHGSVATLEAAAGPRRPDDIAFLHALAADLGRALRGFDTLSRHGGAHGIVGEHFTGTNNHWTGDGTPVFFSFSACGRGWRALDVASFLWVTWLYGVAAEVWDAYLAGYESVRVLSEVERQALPELAKLKMLQTMAFHTSLTRWMGAAFQDDAYWERHFGPLRRWHQEAAAR
jgi:Ser/Thr protein kinase RdoA (MazF antagonist)